MNSLNDLIQSHGMYDPNNVQRPAVDESFVVHDHPPVEAYEQSRYTQASPPPEPRYTPQYPAVQPHYMDRQSPYAAQDRHTIQSMMREISMMQRRLDIMMSSCQDMIERTHVMHEYHHIARYQSQRQMGMTQQPIQTPPPAAQTPMERMREAYAPFEHQSTTVPPQPTTDQNKPLSIKEGVFDGANMISADGDMYVIPKTFLCDESLIEGDIMQAMIFASGQIKYKVSEPTARENIMGILSTHSANSPHYIVQTANKAYKVFTEAVESIGAVPGNQVLLTVPAGGESEWAAIEQVFNA